MKNSYVENPLAALSLCYLATHIWTISWV